MSDPSMIRDVFGNYLRMREQIDKETELPMQKKIKDAMQGCQEEEAIREWLKPLPDRVDNTDDPRTERAIKAEAVGTNPYVETDAPVTTPNIGTKYERELEESQGKFYSTDGRWSDNEEDLETPNQRTERLASGTPALGQPPGYGNKFEYPTHAAVMRATANTPPPLDDVGGCDPNDFFPEERFDAYAPDLDDYITGNTYPTHDPNFIMIASPEQEADLRRELMGIFPSRSRKDFPVCTGVLDFFPLALAELARVSKIAGDKHHPGQAIEWHREKSDDHADCLVRHLMERGLLDIDGIGHSAKVAWRALALLQLELEANTSDVSSSS